MKKCMKDMCQQAEYDWQRQNKYANHHRSTHREYRSISQRLLPYPTKEMFTYPNRLESTPSTVAVVRPAIQYPHYDSSPHKSRNTTFFDYRTNIPAQRLNLLTGKCRCCQYSNSAIQPVHFNY